MSDQPSGAEPKFAFNELLPSDVQNLEHLAVAWRVCAGLAAVFGLCPSIHVFIGFTTLLGSAAGDGSGIPVFIGSVFMLVGLLVMMLIWTMAGLMWYTAGLLRERRRWTFALVVSCIICSSVPIGTTLGVLTLIVLNRPQVKAAFLRNTLDVSGT